MRIDSTRGDDHLLRCDHVRVDPYDHSLRHSLHHIRISRFSDSDDMIVLDPDISLPDHQRSQDEMWEKSDETGLVNSAPIDDERIRQDGIERLVVRRSRNLTHSLSNDLASAELEFIPINGQILLDLDPKLRIGEPDSISRRRSVHPRIRITTQLESLDLNANDRVLLHSMSESFSHEIRDERFSFRLATQSCRSGVDERIPTGDDLESSDVDEGDRFGVSWFEANGGSSGDIESAEE